jgi:hypothetical protein
MVVQWISIPTAYKSARKTFMTPNIQQNREEGTVDAVVANLKCEKRKTEAPQYKKSKDDDEVTTMRSYSLKSF